MIIYVDNNTYKPFGSPSGFSFVEDIVLDFDTNLGTIVTKRIIEKDNEFYAYTFKVENGVITPEDKVEAIKQIKTIKTVYEDHA